MELETHKIKKHNNRTEVFKKRNNPNEIVSIFVGLLKVIGLILFILFGGIALWNGNELSILTVIIVFVCLFAIWMLFEEIKGVVIMLIRNLKPILIIDEATIHILDEGVQFKQIERQRIRSIEGRNYVEIQGVEAPKEVQYMNIYLVLTNGNVLLVDVINTSKLFSPSSRDVEKELKQKAKAIGKLLAKELNTQFYLVQQF